MEEYEFRKTSVARYPEKFEVVISNGDCCAFVGGLGFGHPIVRTAFSKTRAARGQSMLYFTYPVRWARHALNG